MTRVNRHHSRISVTQHTQRVYGIRRRGWLDINDGHLSTVNQSISRLQEGLFMGLVRYETSHRGWKHAPNAECESTRPATFIRIEIVPIIVLAFRCNVRKIFEKRAV